MQIDATLYVNDIVNDALRYLRESTQFRELSGYTEEIGVKMLNETLADISANSTMYPYYYDVTFVANSSKAKYTVGAGSTNDVVMNYLADVSYITATQDKTLYPVEIVNDKRVLSLQRTNEYSTRPCEARVYNQLDADGITYTTIDFIYNPDRDYDISLRCKPSVGQVGLMDTIKTLPLFFRSFLKLSTARKVSSYLGLADIWGARQESEYQEAKGNVENSSKTDMSVITDSSLMGGFGYAFNYIGAANR